MATGTLIPVGIFTRVEFRSMQSHSVTLNTRVGTWKREWPGPWRFTRRVR